MMTAREARKIRRNLELTQRELADALGVTLKTIGRYEQGETRVPPPMALLLRLLKKYPKEVP